jgi:hypothetical protein
MTQSIGVHSHLPDGPLTYPTKTHAPTRGVGAAIAGALGITAMELVGNEVLSLDLPEPIQRERAQASMGATLKAAQALKASPMFHAYDDAVNPIWVVVQEWPGVGVASAGDMGQVGIAYAGNSAYERWFYAGHVELAQSMLEKKAMGSLICAVYVQYCNAACPSTPSPSPNTLSTPQHTHRRSHHIFPITIQPPPHHRSIDPEDRLPYLCSTVRSLFASKVVSSTIFLKVSGPPSFRGLAAWLLLAAVAVVAACCCC